MDDNKFQRFDAMIGGFSLTSESTLLLKDSWLTYNQRRELFNQIAQTSFTTDCVITGLSVKESDLEFQFHTNESFRVPTSDRILKNFLEIILSSECKFLVAVKTKNRYKFVGYNGSFCFLIKTSFKKGFTFKKIRRSKLNRIVHKHLETFFRFTDVFEELEARYGIIPSCIFRIVDVLQL